MNVTVNTDFGTCVVEGEVTSVNNFPVCGLFTFLLIVPTETIVGRFRVETQDLPLFMDPEREGGH